MPLFLKAFVRKWFNLIADRDFKLSLSYVSLRLVSIVDSMVTHRAIFKLGAKHLFLLCLLVKNMPAVYSADRCNFKS